MTVAAIKATKYLGESPEIEVGLGTPADLEVEVMALAQMEIRGLLLSTAEELFLVGWSRCVS